ncbi:MAG: M20 family metallo-hydrolase [Armatimonadota bacterium]
MGEAAVKALDVRADAARIGSRLDQLAAIGRDPGGGLSRFSYTPAHAEACTLIAQWMREAGLRPFLDRVGNLIGLGPGEGPAVAAGSHVDTVPRGGRFDGALGVIGAVECAQSLRDAGGLLRHPFAALAFADEEGNSFGVGCLTSRALVGELPEARTHEIRDREGRTLAERVATWTRPLPDDHPPALAAYLELHIEQGPRLEAEGCDAAAATAIAGITRTTLTFHGQANHGGTTPMHLRRDALWAASALVLEVRRLALASDGEAVATVGRIEVEPGATNVIPGVARMRVELRSGIEIRLGRLRADVEAAGQRLAAEFGLTVTVDGWDHMPATPLDARIQTIVLEAAQRRGLRAISMPSWAGHDAKILAPHLPAGLIFVPSRGGISHSPDEYTDPAQLAAGVQILLDAVRSVDAAPT